MTHLNEKLKTVIFGIAMIFVSMCIGYLVRNDYGQMGALVFGYLGGSALVVALLDHQLEKSERGKKG